jgi:hypothetical protein
MATPTRNRRSADKKQSPINLRDPTQLRIALTSVILAIAYFGLYGPLSGEIDKSRTDLDDEITRFRVICDIERLREQHKLFAGRLSAKTDTNEWVQYVLGGVRKFPLHLLTLDPDKTRDLGPYKAIVVRMALEGSLQDINDFMKWLETNERLIRIDAVDIQPVRNKSGGLMATLTILGLTS